MHFIFNEHPKQSTTIYLGGERTEMTPRRYVALDQSQYNEAAEYTKTFPDLKIVNEDFVNKLQFNPSLVTSVGNQPRAVYAQQDVAPQQEQLQHVEASYMPMHKETPTVKAVSILNENGEKLHISKVNVIDSNGETVGELGLTYNSVTNNISVSSEEFTLTTISTKNQATKTAEVKKEDEVKLDKPVAKTAGKP